MADCLFPREELKPSLFSTDFLDAIGELDLYIGGKLGIFPIFYFFSYLYYFFSYALLRLLLFGMFNGGLFSLLRNMLLTLPLKDFFPLFYFDTDFIFGSSISDLSTVSTRLVFGGNEVGLKLAHL